MKYIVFLLVIYLLQSVNSLPTTSDEDVLTRTDSRVTLQCGGTSRNKIINIISPTAFPSTCAYKVQPLNAYVCQLRVNITYLDLEPATYLPDAGPAPCSCDKDKFIIRGQNMEMCDLIRNQHFYITFDASKPNSQIDLEFILASDRSTLQVYTPSWRLDLEQLQCPPGSPRTLKRQTINNNNNEITDTNLMLRTAFNDAYLIAPKGCFQYYPNPSGIIESFGYNMYLPKMDYSICIKRRDEDTKLTLTGFKIEMSVTAEDEDAPTEGFYDNACPADYLFIPIAAVEPDDTAGDGEDTNYYYKFCGVNTLSKVETTIPAPYVLQFKSDEICSEFEKKFSFRYSVN